MPVLLLHGVPATSALWKSILALLDRDDEVDAPDLPGFAAEPPPGWVPVKESYVDWIVARLEALHARGGPVHLVGHDFGCILSLRAASLRPELLRSLVVGNGPIDPHWPLHALWRSWLVPGEGEAVADRLAKGNPLAPALEGMGFPAADAAANAFTTPGNARRILSLYRSATTVGREWADDLARIVVPTTFIWGERDLVVPMETGRRMAARIGAEFVTVDSEHFWPYQQAEVAAGHMKRLWHRTERHPHTILTQPAFPAEPAWSGTTL